MRSKAPHHIEIAVEENSLKENERIIYYCVKMRDIIIFI